MTSVFGEASTVVGDAFRTGDDSSFRTRDFSVKANASSPLKAGVTSKGKPKTDEFFATMDYTLEERPFFIRIGKDGVIAALEKLDEQLVQVGHHSCWNGT